VSIELERNEESYRSRCEQARSFSPWMTSTGAVILASSEVVNTVRVTTVSTPMILIRSHWRIERRRGSVQSVSLARGRETKTHRRSIVPLLEILFHRVVLSEPEEGDVMINLELKQPRRLRESTCSRELTFWPCRCFGLRRRVVWIRKQRRCMPTYRFLCDTKSKKTATESAKSS